MTRVITSFPVTGLVKLPPKFKVLYVTSREKGADVWFESEFEDYSSIISQLNENYDIWEITTVEPYVEFGDIGEYVGTWEPGKPDLTRHIYMRKIKRGEN